MTQVEEAKQLMTQLIGRVNKLKDKNAEIQDNYDGLRETFEVLAEAYKSSKNEVFNLSAEIKQHEDDKTVLDSQTFEDREELLNKIKMLENEISILKQTNAELQDAIDSQNQTVAIKKDKTEHYYRFGHTSQTVIDQVSLFIKALYNGIDDHSAPYELMSKEYAAKKAEIDENTANVFLRRLCDMRINNKPILFITHNGKINSFYTPDTIIANISAVVKLSSADSHIRLSR